ncbi:DUF1330 domain-containing protein [Duganella sp. LX20W]|uniref:DUF1330 domain-containing protein n=1 Tax=Rugamonas brunnea TaxID=2758569 RepID=A0A7W2ETH4_9BURK|nr:DUF1330 domain-containing protein [Rugamonas brunnea]MBA5638333.1 DUF1330 domain-containing protein [Rugamonas brunnea]
MQQAAYFIFTVDVHDQHGMQPYQAQVAQTYAPYGGKLLVAGGALQAVEGQPPQGRVIILQFPSVEQAQAWHASGAYQAILGYRLASATSDGYLVEGCALAG